MSMINPEEIPKFENQLVIPPAFSPKVIRGKKSRKVIGHKYKVEVNQFEQQVLPDEFPETTVWGYGGKIKDPLTGKRVFFQNYPGPTFEAVRGIPVHVEWINNLTGPHLFPVDPTLHWANPNHFHPTGPPFIPYPPGYPEAQFPVPIVTHLHGGETPSAYDGQPDTWFTANGIKGPEFVTRNYTYPNKQEPATLWYHDHVLGITRLNVMAGLAGFYLLRDRNDPIAPLLPSGEFEIPLAIQDRTFNKDGSIFFYDQEGVNPEIHPYWVPEFFGNTIVVNGKVWPNLNVKPRQYRFRILNGSNARFYNLSLPNNHPFIQIGSDGGYLPEPVELTSLLISPGERADVLIDFSSFEPGTQLILTNDANAPFPDGDEPDEHTSQIMRFTVISDTPTPQIVLPSTLNTIPNLTPTKTRTLTLVEQMGPDGPVVMFLNGQPWDRPITELPKAGTTEEWEIVNTTADTHPIHLHLVQFLLKNRQNMDTEQYLIDWIALNGGEEPPYESEPVSLPVDNYLDGEPIPPPANERGWKDTLQMNPGQVTRILVRFTSQDGSPFPFNASDGPGYVWHCHILEHEDNEMMRPYRVVDDEP